MLLTRARDQGRGVSATYPIPARDARALTLEVLRVRGGFAIGSWADQGAFIKNRPGLDSDGAIIAAIGSPMFATFDVNPPVALGIFVYGRGDQQSEVVAVSQVKAFFGHKEAPAAERQFHEALAAALKTRLAAGAGPPSTTPPAGLVTTPHSP